MPTKLCYWVTVSLGARSSLLPLLPHFENLRHTPGGEQQTSYSLRKPDGKTRTCLKKARPLEQLLPLKCSVSEQPFPPNSFSFPPRGHNEGPSISPFNRGPSAAIRGGLFYCHWDRGLGADGGTY